MDFVEGLDGGSPSFALSEPDLVPAADHLDVLLLCASRVPGLFGQGLVIRATKSPEVAAFLLHAAPLSVTFGRDYYGHRPSHRHRGAAADGARLVLDEARRCAISAAVIVASSQLEPECARDVIQATVRANARGGR
jgi:hypothetical protein